VRGAVVTVDIRISRLTRLPHWSKFLTHANLSFTSVTSGVSICLLCSSCSQLESLDLSYCHHLDRYSLAWLVMARKLTRLVLKGCAQIDDFAIGFLPKTARALTFLDISSLPCVTHRCLYDVMQLPQLRHLDLCDSLNIDDWKPLLAVSGTAPPLCSLSLPGNEEVTDSQLCTLADRYPQLESLALFVGDSDLFTGASLQHLTRRCSRLHKLDMAISHPNSLVHALPALRTLPSVALDLCYGAFTDDIVRSIALNVPCLTSLCFYANPDDLPVYHMTAETLQLFTQHCPLITRLQLFASKLPAAALKLIGRFTRLTQLDLTSPNVANAPLRYLAASLPRLTQLVLLMPQKAQEAASLNSCFLSLSHLTHVVLFLDVFTDNDMSRLGNEFYMFTWLTL
jgi:hypothetical protein